MTHMFVMLTVQSMVCNGYRGRPKMSSSSDMV
jgi:hypothetical protein